jgi:hypothetical protein
LLSLDLNHSIPTNNHKTAKRETALERVLNSLLTEFRGKEFMKIKIIKRTASEKIKEEKPAAENKQTAKINGRKVTETVKSWIDDLRQKRERERLSVKELFRIEPCT